MSGSQPKILLSLREVSDIPAPATTGKNLEDIIPSEIAVTKDKYCDSIYLRCMEQRPAHRDCKADGGWGEGGRVVV